MTTDNDTAKALTAAKTAETKAQNALMQNDDPAKIGELAAEFLKAQKAREAAERADIAANQAEFIGRIGESTETVRAAVNSDALAEAMNVLRQAGIKKIEIAIEGEGVYTVSTHSGKRGAAPGSTRKTEKYEIEVAGVATEFTPGAVISQFGSRMSNHDERLAAIAAKTLTRKEYAREIVESMGGTVIGGDAS